MPPARLSRIAGRSALSEPPSRSSTARISSISSVMAEPLSVLSFRPTRSPALDPILGVVARRLIGALGNPQTLQPDLLAGLVHHREHVRQSLVLLPHQIADRALLLAKAHHASRTGVNAELVLDRHALDIVALRRRAIRADKEFGHQKQ